MTASHIEIKSVRFEIVCQWINQNKTIQPQSNTRRMGESAMTQISIKRLLTLYQVAFEIYSWASLVCDLLIYCLDYTNLEQQGKFLTGFCPLPFFLPLHIK